MQTRSRQVALLLFDELELRDVSAIATVLSEAGRKWNWRPFRLVTVCASTGPVSSRSQIQLLAESSLQQISSADVLVVPGGYGARLAARDAGTIRWCATIAEHAEHWLAIGEGLGLLGRADLLEGRRIASSTALSPWLEESCPGALQQLGSEVVEDGPLLSVCSGALAAELALRLVGQTLGPKLADPLRLALQAPSEERLELDRRPASG